MFITTLDLITIIMTMYFIQNVLNKFITFCEFQNNKYHLHCITRGRHLNILGLISFIKEII